MKLTTKSEYSILALLYMARHEREGFIKIDKICSHCDIPRKYLELLLNSLRQNRYIKTRRGTAGGYNLARQANQITIAEIVRLMDGALAPTESVSQFFYNNTPLSKEPSLLKILKEIRDYIASRLEKVTLADLV